MNTDTSAISEYLVDEIFPTREVHLIGGPSGAGKSTWLLQMMDDWRQGKPVLERASHPQAFLYISADRSRLSVHRTFARVGLDLSQFPFESMETLSSHSLLTVLRASLSRRPETRVFFIEGFQSFCRNMNDYDSVNKFLTEAGKFCVDKNITIFGVCHASKTKKDEGYENPRQKINGSVAWAGFAETIIYIEPKVADDPNNKSRTISILPRNLSETQFTLEFKDGRLVLTATKPKSAVSPSARFESWLAEQSAGDIFRGSDLQKQLSMAESTFFFEIDRLTKSKRINKLEPGLYVILQPSAPPNS